MSATGTDMPDRLSSADAGIRDPKRRALLVFWTPPRSKPDGLLLIAGRVPRSQVRVVLRYIPGKRMIEHRSWDAYLGALGELLPEGIEAIAYAILEDLNNELVPRWVEILVELDSGHKILLEDRQPNWDNPALLARLAPF